MNTRQQISDWIAGATPEQIIDRLERAEREAFLWHVAMTACTPTVAEPLRRSCEKVAATLISGGYKRQDTE